MENIRIQDDLYEYVNKEWLENAVIPSDKPSIDAFRELDNEVEKISINDLNEMVKNNSYPNDYLKNACQLYEKAKDIKKRNKDGIKPVLKTLQKIEKLETINDLNKKLKEFVEESIPTPFYMFVEVDMKDATKHSLYIKAPEIILPDSTFYKEGMEDRKNLFLNLYSGMAKKLLSFTGLDEETIDKYVADTLKFDELIAKYVKSNEELSEYAKLYNPFKTSKVSSLLKPIKFKKLLDKTFGFIPEITIVSEPRYFKSFKEVFNEETFILYKHWAYVSTLILSSSLLSEELREIGGSYLRAISGTKEMTSFEKFAYHLTSSIYSEPIGLYYGEKYFGEKAKKNVVEMVMEIIDAYKERVKNSDVLSDSTKEKAILKLSTLKVKMGYPDKVEEIYDKLVFDSKDSLFKAISNLKKIKYLDNLADLTKEVDRSKWMMPGNMVNACYNPFSNDITFPAAVLQPPFYSINQSKSQNLGGIGAVIGHEISHAFDNNGSLFDENGSLNNWWTKEDFKKFNLKTKAMIKQFDGIELPFGKVNGKFIVSENIADNGGVAVTLHIMSHTKDANYTEYFENWARVWRMKSSNEFKVLLLSMDVHGPNVLRANMPPRNFQEWYDTFNVKKSDRMYIPLNKRIVIW